VLAHPKFRAGYDFLCLRAKSGESVEADCAWWTELQQLPEAGRKSAFTGKEKSKPRRRRRRKPGNAGGDAEAVAARTDTQPDSQ